jgi:chemotaxis protein methyltransferase WspC
MSARRTAETLLAERIGLDPQTVGAGAIARAVDARMSALQLDDRDAYLRQLSSSDLEQQELIEEVVVPESWFFRDERPFAALRSFVAAGRWATDTSPRGAALRVLSIPCGCGEEPYSIAIALRDLELAPDRFQIDAVDVSARHLVVAQRGAYRANSFRGADLSFRDRYFRPGPDRGTFQLDDSIRATVRFSRGNLLDPQLLSGQLPYDVVFCRNVLIYFNDASRRQALATLDRLLGPAGLLFLGHAERLAIDALKFEPYGDRASFAFRRTARESPEPARTAADQGRPVRTEPRPPRTGQSEGEAPSEPGSERVRAQEASPGARSDSGKPTALLSSLLLPEGGFRALALPESAATLLDQAAALADGGRIDAAAVCCEASLGRFGPSARAFFLLGLIRQAGGRQAEAEDCFRKTIYLEPGHDEALLALSLCAERRGDSEAAAAYRRRADRARGRKGRS